MPNQENEVKEPTVDTSTTDEGETGKTEAQSNPHESKASELGWVSKEEWVEQGKDPDDWKPAKLFLEHGDMIGKIRSQAKELDDTRRAMQFVHAKNQEVYARGYQQAITELRQQKRAALADGDFVKADELDEKIDVTKAELTKVVHTPPPVVQNQVDPKFIEWSKRNGWYGEPRLQKFADAIAIEYININKGQVTPDDVFDFVEKEIKKEFPHKFPKKTQGAPNPDGEGRANKGGTTSNRLEPKLAQAEANMSDQEKSIMRTMIRQTGMTKEKYLKLYATA